MIENIIDKLKQIIADDLDVNLKQEEIDENVSLFEEGLGLDSVVIMEFVNLIEAHFDFQFSENELNLEPFKNLKTLADFISSKTIVQQ
ncbi:MAG: acyl carrier protein [SAR324 cluster bacterium]|nr:acyl carrier protein [SAR324 cluster bacterium]MBF0352092.1 acyl carrier protein [SAR324 cluster bacterium]